MSLRDRLRRLKPGVKLRINPTTYTPTPELMTRETRVAPPLTSNPTDLQDLILLESIMDYEDHLRVVVKELIQCNTIFGVRWNERKDYKVLQDELAILFKEFKEYYEKARRSHIVPIYLTRVMGKLCGSVQRELSHIREEGDDGPTQHIEIRDDHVFASYRRIWGYIQRIIFNLDATASIWDPLSYRPLTAYEPAYRFEPKHTTCTKGTRVDVISRILAWVDSPASSPVYWISGMAGTGKTTIARSLCDELNANGELTASVFCSRLKPPCRDARSIIPSIAYQLAELSHPFNLALLRESQKDSEICHGVPHDQFASLIAHPLLEVKHTLPDNRLVVVIDALDECDDKECTRLIVDSLLTMSSELPVKWIVSSRAEPEIRGPMIKQEHQEASRVVLHELGSLTVKADIKTFLQDSLEPLKPTEDEIMGLVEQAGVLFVYAEAIVRYIYCNNSMGGPRSRLASILGASNTSQVECCSGIDALYAVVLREALVHSDLNEADKDGMRQVLYIVGCAQNPLTSGTISKLLKISTDRVHAALEPLWSVLHISEAHDYITFLHPTFPAYILDLSRSGEYCCDPKAYGQTMAQLCFRILRNTSPQFNICNLISSYVSDSEIEEIGTALDRAVPADLFYAAQHWAIHLQYVIRPTELIQELEEFLAVRLLLWMEIMNLKKCAYKMPEVLRLTKEWDESRAHCPAHVRALIHDAWQFTTIFASSGVSISTPHIYTSMLLFWPDSSPIANYYARRFTASIQLEGTAIAQRRRALLATWHFDHATRSPVYSPDGTLIAVGVGDDVLLLSAWTGRVVFRPLKGHKGTVLSIQFSPDGDCIVSGSTDKTVRLWSTLNGRSIAGPLDGHDGNVNSVAFSPDGTRIVSGAHDGTICIWNCGDGKRLFGPLIGFHESINEIKYSRNGSQMVTCGRRGAALRNAEDGNLLKEFLPGNGDNSFRSVDISPDSTRIVSGSINNGIYVWEIQSGQLISSLSTSILVGRARNPFISVSFSPDGKHLISTLPCGIVGFWDIQTGKLALDPLKGHTDNITSVRFSPNGAFVVSGSYDKTLRLWNIRNVQAEPNSLQGHDDSVTSVAFSPAGTHLVSGSNDQTIYVWDIMRKQMVLGPLEKSSNDKVSIAYSPDGTRIISHSRDGLVVLDAQTGNIAFGPFQSLQPIQSVSFSPDGTRIILGSTNNALHILAVDTGETIMNICPPLNDQSNWVHVTSAVFSPDGSRIAVGSMHSNLMMFDAHNGMLLYDPLEGHTNGSRSLGFSPDSTRIACGSFSVVLVWDVESGRLVLGPLEGHTGRINSVEYSPDGTYIVSGARDNAVCIWNAQTGEPVLGLSKWHTAPVRSVKFSPDGTQVVSGSDDKTIRVTDIREEFRYSSDSSTPTGTDWELNADGWVVDKEKRLLVWVPPELRTVLMWPRTQQLISRDGWLRLNFAEAHIGYSWREYYNIVSEG